MDLSQIIIASNCLVINREVKKQIIIKTVSSVISFSKIVLSSLAIS